MVDCVRVVISYFVIINLHETRQFHICKNEFYVEILNTKKKSRNSAQLQSMLTKSYSFFVLKLNRVFIFVLLLLVWVKYDLGHLKMLLLEARIHFLYNNETWHNWNIQRIYLLSIVHSCSSNLRNAKMFRDDNWTDGRTDGRTHGKNKLVYFHSIFSCVLSTSTAVCHENVRIKFSRISRHQNEMKKRLKSRS